VVFSSGLAGVRRAGGGEAGCDPTGAGDLDRFAAQYGVEMFGEVAVDL
jgi:hypothetical protein